VEKGYWPHRRQFVFGPRPCPILANWRTLAVDGGMVLSHCPELPVVQARDRDGTEWTLIGLAIQADPDRPRPEEDLTRHGTADVPSCYDSWAGSWLLIGGF
jgi:hypothetical protein